MAIEKILGWVLLVAGILIIFWTLFSSYNFFTEKANLPQFFKLETEKSKTPQKLKTPTSIEEIQKQLGQIVEEQLKEILPTMVLEKFFNLISWSILAGILIFGGSQIATLGIKLLKSS